MYSSAVDVATVGRMAEKWLTGFRPRDADRTFSYLVNRMESVSKEHLGRDWAVISPHWIRRGESSSGAELWWMKSRVITLTEAIAHHPEQVRGLISPRGGRSELIQLADLEDIIMRMVGAAVVFPVVTDTLFRLFTDEVISSEMLDTPPLERITIGLIDQGFGDSQFHAWDRIDDRLIQILGSPSSAMGFLAQITEELNRHSWIGSAEQILMTTESIARLVSEGVPFSVAVESS